MMDSGATSTLLVADAILLCRARSRLCALPLAHVVETMRPLRVEPFGGAPDFVVGLSRIRGEHVPVIDLGRLLGLPDGAEPTRLVLLRVGARAVAVQVDAVIGISTLPEKSARELPPLLSDAADGTVAALAARDAELLLVLQAARLFPPQDDIVPKARGDA